MKNLTKQQKKRAREILAQTHPEDLLWISDAALDAYDKKKPGNWDKTHPFVKELDK